MKVEILTPGQVEAIVRNKLSQVRKYYYEITNIQRNKITTLEEEVKILHNLIKSLEKQITKR